MRLALHFLAGGGGWRRREDKPGNEISSSLSCRGRGVEGGGGGGRTSLGMRLALHLLAGGGGWRRREWECVSLTQHPLADLIITQDL